MNMTKTLLATSISAAVSLLTSAPAFAQEQGQYQGLEEIVVTAQKRETSLQQSSASIEVIDDQALARRSIVNLRDLQGVLPGATVGTDALGLELTIRGVSNGAGEAGETSVAFHNDGIYTGVNNALFYDVDRIEVIYGPQGTLYGRNATGGAVNVITYKPEADSFYGNIEQTFGDYSRSLTKGAINIPIVKDVLAIRAAGVLEDRDGYSLNTATGEHSGQIDDRSSARFSLGYTPTEKLSVTLRASVNKVDGTNGGDSAPSLQEIVDPNDPGTLLAPLPASLALLSADQIARNQQNPLDFPLLNDGVVVVDEKAFSAEISWQFAGLKLDYTGGKLNSDSGGSVGQLINEFSTLGDIRVNEIDEISHELRLSSNTDSSLDWMIGLFMFESERNANVFLDLKVDAFDTIDITTDLDKTKAEAVFASVGYQFNEALRLKLGVRHSEDEKVRIETSQLKLIDLFGGFTFPFVNDNQREFESDDWSFGIDYQLDEDHLVYFSASSGYKSGGLNSASSGLLTFEPEEIIALELGTKNRLSDNLILNGTLFTYDYEDYQVLVPNPANFTESTVANAAQVDFLGAELTLQYRREALLLQANMSYLKAEFDDGTMLFDGVLGREVDVSNLDLKKAPSFTGNLSASYEWALASGILSLQGDLSISSKYNLSFTPLYNPGLDRVDVQDGYERLDLRLAYETANEHLVELFVKNATDELIRTGFIGYDASSGFVSYSYDAPRTYGVRLKYNF